MTHFFMGSKWLVWSWYSNSSKSISTMSKRLPLWVGLSSSSKHPGDFLVACRWLQVSYWTPLVSPCFTIDHFHLVAAGETTQVDDSKNNQAVVQILLMEMDKIIKTYPMNPMIFWRHDPPSTSNSDVLTHNHGENSPGPCMFWFSATP